MANIQTPQSPGRAWSMLLLASIFEIGYALSVGGSYVFACAAPLAAIGALAAARMDGTEFHRTQANLTLRRDLRVTIEPARESAAPGEEVEVAVPLDHIAYRLPEGHRLRVAVSTAYWPMIWPAPGAAALTICGGALELPLREGAGEGDEWHFPPPESAPPERCVVHRPEAHVRRSETDQRSGKVSAANLRNA